MFSKSITNSSRFLMMPPTSQLLYFQFGMNADDDGFCEHFTIMRMTEAKPDDLKVLVLKGFVKVFDEKVLIITDWKENNYLRSDRYTPSKYLEEYKEELKMISNNEDIIGIPNGNQMATEVRLGKVRLGKVNIASQAMQKDNITKQIVNYFFELKGWDNKEKDFYSKNRIVYSRFTRPAKELAELCDNNLEEAKICLKKIADWANSRNLDWSIETIFKKWYDIDLLKPKEKKPYIDGMRAFQKIEGGKWYVVSRDGETKEYGAIPKEVIYK